MEELMNLAKENLCSLTGKDHMMTRTSGNTRKQPLIAKATFG